MLKFNEMTNKCANVNQAVVELNDEFSIIPLSTITKEALQGFKAKMANLLRLIHSYIIMLDEMQSKLIALPNGRELLNQSLIIKADLKKSRDHGETLVRSIIEMQKQFSLPSPTKFKAVFSLFSQPSFERPKKYTKTLATISEFFHEEAKQDEEQTINSAGCYIISTSENLTG